MLTPYFASFFFFYRNRLSKAIENLQHFSLAADPSFRHFQLDVSKELKLLTELNFIQGKGWRYQRGTRSEHQEGNGFHK